MLRVSLQELSQEFRRALDKAGFAPEKSALCARIFTENTRDGVLSHGVNRFSEFIDFVRRGVVKVDAEPVLVEACGAFERWDGRQGPGMLNAHACMARAIAMAQAHTVGCVALRNTNHWMRAGTYGRQAADAGCIGLCWTNTRVLMPPWGSSEPKLGNNPLMICVPAKGGQVLLDMSMSQFSMGKLAIAAKAGEKLSVPGGFDEGGNLTDDAAAILRAQRPLPIGYWKGSGLALLLDCVVSVLSAGQAVFQIGNHPDETRVSQLFVAISLEKAGCAETGAELMEQILDDLHAATPLNSAQPVSFPGERTSRRRRANSADGVLVDEDIWQAIKRL
jgi:3-dehydro-L-gulonate 2-dehydrogenase